MTGSATETSRRTSHEAWLVVSVILAVFVSALLLVTHRLRKEVRAKIIQQDGIALAAPLLVSPSLAQELPEEDANDPDVLFAAISDKVLEASRRKEFRGVRLFNQTGALQLSVGGGSGDLAPEHLAQLQNGNPIDWFESQANLNSFVDDSDAKVPLIHTIVPLKRAERFIGAAEFISDGREVMEGLQKLDRDLWFYAGLIFLMVVGITAGASFGHVGLWRARPC